MRLRHITLLFLLPLLVLPGCRERHEWHQKLTMVVETPAGERTGAAVVEVRAIFGQQIMSQAEVQYGYTGEATVVEVAPGKYLFALLGGTEERYACAAGPALNWRGPWLPRPRAKPRGEWLAEVPRQAGKPPVPVPKGCLPLMVTFTDIEDPKSVQRVDPDDLAVSFGPGVRLTAVTLAVTEEPVSAGKVEAVLGWLSGYKQSQWRLNGERCIACPVSSARLADMLDSSDFLVWGK